MDLGQFLYTIFNTEIQAFCFFSLLDRTAVGKFQKIEIFGENIWTLIVEYCIKN